MKNKDQKIMIECECLSEILRWEYLESFDEVSIITYHLGHFKRKRFAHEVIINREKASQIVKFLQEFIDKRVETK